ncbi:MAG: hypothetical protein AVO39_10035 [delta proteobacterium MLS_D]|jgi:flagellar hook-associated protein 3 FlgL|nr:MAG: hypothetical protein AVO39_10035 [delta proteobacterium MLS_D]
MSMRVTEMMRFNTMRTHLDSVQTRYAEILEKMASQRTINKISDDPSGVAMIMNYKKSQSSLSGYRRAIENAEAWITMTESQLTAADDILVKAREIALSQGTGTATEETRLYAAEQVSQLIDHLQSIANSQYADRYLFSGTKTGTEPFSATPSAEPWLGDPGQAADNGFQGDLTVSGSYSGDENRTYAAKIVSDDGSGNYTWAVSDDGGRSWGPESGPAVLEEGSTITIDAEEGIELEFSSVTEGPAEGDVFYVEAFAAGYYRGNADELSAEITKGVTFEYSITGDSIFDGSGEDAVDVFKVLDDLKVALENNETEGILNRVDELKQASVQVNTGIAKCGTRINRLEIAGNNLTDLDFKLTEMISSREDVDISALVTEFAMQEIVLNATYSVASRMGNITLLDFLA